MQKYLLIFFAVVLFSDCGSRIPQYEERPVHQYLGFNGMLKSSPVGYNVNHFLTAIDSLHGEEFRAPGGTFSKTYNWHFDIPSPTDLQTLVNHTHCRMSLVLNMITDSLPDQILWLKTLRNLGVFDTALDIEMSNECNYPESEEMIKYGSPEKFSKECKIWIKEIKLQFPDVHILFAIPGGNKKGKTMSDWNQVMLSKNPDVNLVFHYHNPRYYVFDGFVDTALVSFLIDSVKQAEFGNFPWSRISVTEFNLRNEDADEDIYFEDEYQHGLAAECMMRKLYRNGAARVLFHNVTQAEGNGAIQSTKKQSYVSPTGKALSEFITGNRVN